MAGPQAWLDGPKGERMDGCIEERMDKRTNRKSPHSTGFCPAAQKERLTDPQTHGLTDKTTYRVDFCN